MTKQARFLKHCLKKGESATVNDRDGDDCPCLDDNGDYVAEWHRLNPSPGNEDCNGTGVINASTPGVAIKGFFFPPDASTPHLINQDAKTAIGSIDGIDLVHWGAATVSTGAAYDLTALTIDEDTITYNSSTYSVRKVIDVQDVFQVALLVKVS